MANKKSIATESVEIRGISPKHVKIRIIGDSDLVLNKMNAVSMRTLIDQRKNKAKSLETPNEWEAIITSMHWLHGTPTDFSEEGLRDALINNAPCISAFGLKKSFNQALTRNKVATYSTEFDATVNVSSVGGLIPITFTEHFIDEKLMSPKRGAPVLVRLNRFTGWSADIEISYLDNVYSLEQILSIVSLAGFGIGIGSGRTSGFGRYHIQEGELN